MIPDFNYQEVFLPKQTSLGRKKIFETSTAFPFHKLWLVMYGGNNVNDGTYTIMANVIGLRGGNGVFSLPANFNGSTTVGYLSCVFPFTYASSLNSLTTDMLKVQGICSGPTTDLVLIPFRFNAAIEELHVSLNSYSPTVSGGKWHLWAALKSSNFPV